MGGVQAAPVTAKYAVETACRMCGGAFAPVEAPWTNDRQDWFFALRPMPLANAYCENTDHEDDLYPLTLARCGACGLVQLRETVAPDILYGGDYPYMPSGSRTMVRHFRALADRYGKAGEFVLDIGSNDGTLLSAFQERGCRVLGVEPALNLAEIARREGVPTECCFFDEETAATIRERHGQPDVITATNLLANVADPRCILLAVAALLAPEGKFIVETPDFDWLSWAGAFDMLYHEHFSYFDVASLQKALAAVGFGRVRWSLETVHGRTVRAVARRGKVGGEVVSRPGKIGVWTARVGGDLINYLMGAEGRVVGYGCPAKATVLLNQVSGVAHRVEYITDSLPTKQGKFLPGLHIPIVPPSRLETETPDHIIVLAWNFREEILAKLESPRKRGAKVVFPIPRLEVL